MSIETISRFACFGGVQSFHRHDAGTIGAPMRFGVFRPDGLDADAPALIFLAGLTCNEETFAMKAGAQRHAAEHGLLLITPDTSPRDTGIAGATADWDFGEGAGFYLDATQAPWRDSFRMESWITIELIDVLVNEFGMDPIRMSIFGHSMGGHGALTLALRHPGLYRSVSAFAPITAPVRCPWGKKAFSAYLGDDITEWKQHDASALMQKTCCPYPAGILIHQGLSDKFLTEQLFLDVFEESCRLARQPLDIQRHAGYDHSYYFISTFVEAHFRFHARLLN